jgi:hypothetical protein
MDDQLKKDITEAFFDEYRKAEAAKAGGLVKMSRAVFNEADKVTSKAGLSGPGVLLLGSLLVTAAAPPVGIAMLGAWIVAGVSNIVGMVKESNNAQKALDADIENGKLTERYHAVLDTKERELAETQELYKSQRAQLPPKGAAVEAFANAGQTKEPTAAPAPAAPASQPKP